MSDTMEIVLNTNASRNP